MKKEIKLEVKKAKAYGKWILVKPADPDSRENKYGLIVPDNQEQEPKVFGTVLSVGEEVKGILKGQMIVFGKYAGEDITQEDEKGKKQKYMVVHNDDVILFQ